MLILYFIIKEIGLIEKIAKEVIISFIFLNELLSKLSVELNRDGEKIVEERK